jgi:adenylate cyclase
MIMQEIERKFLVDTNKWSPSGKGVQIRQGYLSDDPQRSVRVRIADEKSFLTIKGKSEGITRTELEYDIPLKDAKLLMKLALNEPVSKTRYKEKIGSFEWEIDVFEGNNKGLVMAEIELEDEDQQFVMPEWAEKEVSGDKRYFNLWLSKKPFQTWQG